MKDDLFIDTSAFYAFVDKKDKNHKKVSAILRQPSASFFTSNYVVDELITLFRVRGLPLGYFSEFVGDLLQDTICRIIRITPSMEMDAWVLLKKYNEHSFSFTDCTSFVAMKETKLFKACSLDKHFAIAGFHVLP